MQPFGPFDGSLTDDGKLHGRGSCDTKATFAIALTILSELKANGGQLPGNTEHTPQSQSSYVHLRPGDLPQTVLGTDGGGDRLQ